MRVQALGTAGFGMRNTKSWVNPKLEKVARMSLSFWRELIVTGRVELKRRQTAPSRAGRAKALLV